jgi:transcription initiation factor TFIID subunit 5
MCLSLSVTSIEFAQKIPNNFFFFRGHNYPIWCVDEGSNYIATGSKDTTARLWSYDRKYPLKTYVGHVQDVDVS